MQAKITAFAVAGWLVLSGTAQAEPGFTPDPQSPAGVEYQIPLDTARGQGGGNHGGGTGAPSSPSGGTASPGGGSGASNLFGSGITPQPKPGSAHPKASGDNGRQKPGRGTRVRSSRGQAVAPPVAASASYSSTGPLAAVVGAVLLLGGGIGLLLRLRARRTHAS